ncbi:response regulator transcription factor [Microbacterium sp. NM3R9]|uniref:response regulator n=1 Tax=Microbacterium thalli TaxID=3027921 RepID=UPI002366AEE7|nr:response regulator transcription factor [Microbacterium thalli]MDN8548179.1 response regulator transcription factor [Microbacterium thalli]
MIRLLIADDHPVVRAGLAGLLSDEPGFEVVGEAADGAEATALAAELQPDVVLMDLRMPHVDGVAATSRIVASRGDAAAPRVLILTTYESDDQILAAIEAGASGYLLKAAPREEIVAGIRSVAAGQSALSPSVAVRLVERMRHPEPAPSALTPREVDVLRLVAAGHANKRIAVELGIGESTVKTHLLRIYEKLGVDTRTRAVTLALERGVLGGGSTGR